jgi:hypothetical protein
MNMNSWCRTMFLATCLVGVHTVAHAQSAPEIPGSTAAPAPLDVVTLKDGSVIYGEVVEMSGGILFLKTASSPDTWIKPESGVKSDGFTA